MTDPIHTYAGMTSAELETAFAMIENPEDWRGPINAMIRESDFSRCALACDFYTSTRLYKDGLGRNLTGGGNSEIIHVRADGHRDGPAGP